MIPKPWVRRLQPVPHGGKRQLAARGLDPDALIDFSATLLPIPTPQPVLRALAACDVRAYPDPHCTGLLAALSAHTGLPQAQLLVGNGSIELLYAAVRACVGPGDRVVIVGPTFGEYRAAVLQAGAEPVQVQEGADLPARVRASSPQLIVVCNPNNPTGRLTSEDTLAQLQGIAPLLLDEAYMGFLQPPPAPAWRPGRLVLRSLTKDHALAGLRVGYAVGDPGFLAAVRALLLPWGVNALAQAAATVAVSHPQLYAPGIAAVWLERERLMGAIADLGWAVQGGHAPYFLVRTPGAQACFERLLAQGVVVRSCVSFGLPEHIRISPQTPAQGDRLLACLGPADP